MKYIRILVVMLSFASMMLSITSPRIFASERIHAPDFPKGLNWLNSGPLTLKDLQGKVVLLDFWTYGCINCIHIIPDLNRLEANYKNELVIIGVHSAKFENEQLTKNIRQAVVRYGIDHPIINDNGFKVWNEYAVNAWPTLVLIDPEGYIVGAISGEGAYDAFNDLIGATIKEFDAKKEINRNPIKLTLEQEQMPQSILSYPGKIEADEKSGRLFFTDSDHNKVIISTLKGEILEVIGAGNQGFKDGDFQTAEFSHPQGVYYDTTANVIYIADTGNHAIRKIDLVSKMVETLAGNGRQAPFMADGGIGKNAVLNSPWDLIREGDRLYIAMAGSHQIWMLNLKTFEAKVFAGSGGEGITEGDLKSAELAQPSGITTDGKFLYIADSEASGIVQADMTNNGKLRTLIGIGLFDFGDIDGKYPKARLQHALGVAYHDGYIYIADTYNHKIKRLDPKTKEVTTLIGTGQPGLEDGPRAKAMLNEPNGLTFAGDKMYITDTNNGLIRVFDLKTNTILTLELTGIDKLAMGKSNTFLGDEIKLPVTQIAPSTKKLTISIVLPKGLEFNSDAPFSITAQSDKPEVLNIKSDHIKKAEAILELSVLAKTGMANVTVDMNIYYCSLGNRGQCFFKEAKLNIPVNVTSSGSDIFSANYQINN